MQIECPSCSTDNKIEFGENIVCSECKGSFAGHSYKKFKKRLFQQQPLCLLVYLEHIKLIKCFLKIRDTRLLLNMN